MLLLFFKKQMNKVKNFQLKTFPNLHYFVKEFNLERRAELMLQQAAKMDCRQFVSPRDITAGNSKLNLAFVANLFNMHPGLRGAKANKGNWDSIEGEIFLPLFN